MPTIEYILSVADLRGLFEVRDGVLHWKLRQPTTRSNKMFNSRYAGKPCGRPDSSGYLQTGVTIDGYTYRVANHRIIYAIAQGKWPSQNELVDHRDRDRKFNNDSNLRIATKAQNYFNAAKRSDNSSGFKGVSFHKRRGKWLAQCQLRTAPCGKRTTTLHKFFDTPEEAADCYDRHIKKHFGEFAVTNRALNLL